MTETAFVYCKLDLIRFAESFTHHTREIEEGEMEDIIWNCVGRQTPMSKYESKIAAKAIAKLLRKEPK